MKVAIVGSGRMANMLIKALMIKKHDVIVWARNENKLNIIRDTFNCRTTKNIQTISKEEIIFLAIPSDAIKEIFNNLQRFNSYKLIISLAPELDLKQLKLLFNNNRVLRFICSPAIVRGNSHILISCDHDNQYDLKILFEKLFSNITIKYIDDKDMYQAIVIFSTIGVLLYVMNQLKLQAIKEKISISLFDDVCDIIPKELDNLFSLANHDINSIENLCRTPGGIVSKMISYLNLANLDGASEDIFIQNMQGGK